MNPLALLGILRAVPVWAFVLVAALAWGGWNAWQATAARQAAAAQRAQASEANAQAEREARAVEARRRAEIDKEVARVTKDAALDKRRAADLARTAGSLREHVTRLATQGCGDPTAVAASAPATGPGLVLAELYRGADDEAQELARAYDAAHRAGLSCERAFEAMRIEK